MTTENEHRVDPSVCAAHGCPGLATHSRGTNGESPWYCFVHFSNEPADSLRITHELNRLRWLVDVVRALRAGAGVSHDQRQAFMLAQRTDLDRKESEDRRQWYIRLEGVLAKSCADTLVQP